MKKLFPIAAVAALLTAAPCHLAQAQAQSQTQNKAQVYFTRDISPEGLLKVYKALGVEAKGRVAVKISTGESMKSNHLSPELIAPLVKVVNGTLVECNTAYGGSRFTTESHRAEIAKRGYDKIAAVDIMDEEGEIRIPVADDKWIKYDIVGSHIQNYDFMINLAHFKGHAMGGFGGVLKNASIGVASANGKVNIHSAGKSQHTKPNGDLQAPAGWFESPQKNTPFIESMSAAAQAVHNYFMQREGIVYIDVMNNISIDCDCDGNPHKPTIQDIGIAASLDPVALDKFCLDRVMNLPQDKNNDTKALLERIEQRHGTRIVFRGEEMGLGSTKYQVVDLDAQPGQTALDVIFSRKSVRTYADKPVSDEQVETLLKAAMAAPTGMNVQPWRFVVVRDQAVKDRIAGRNRMISKAPVAFVVCGETQLKNGQPNKNWTADCAAASENLLIAAEALGLGAVWTACYPYEERMSTVIEALGLPEEVKPLCVIPVGYPAGNDKPKDKWKPENIHYDKW